MTRSKILNRKNYLSVVCCIGLLSLCAGTKGYAQIKPGRGTIKLDSSLTAPKVVLEEKLPASIIIRDDLTAMLRFETSKLDSIFKEQLGTSIAVYQKKVIVAAYQLNNYNGGLEYELYVYNEKMPQVLINGKSIIYWDSFDLVHIIKRIISWKYTAVNPKSIDLEDGKHSFGLLEFEVSCL